MLTSKAFITTTVITAKTPKHIAMKLVTYVSDTEEPIVLPLVIFAAGTGIMIAIFARARAVFSFLIKNINAVLAEKQVSRLAQFVKGQGNLTARKSVRNAKGKSEC